MAAQALREANTPNVRSVLVSDRAAVDTCRWFADEYRALVEPACGAALFVLLQAHPALTPVRDAVAIVCGGIGVTLAKLAHWHQILPLG